MISIRGNIDFHGERLRMDNDMTWGELLEWMQDHGVTSDIDINYPTKDGHLKLGIEEQLDGRKAITLV